MNKAELRAVAWLVRESTFHCLRQGLGDAGECESCPIHGCGESGDECLGYNIDHIARIIAEKRRIRKLYDRVLCLMVERDR